MSQRPRVPPTHAPDAVRRLVGPLYFGIACAIGLAAALIIALVPSGLAGTTRAAMSAAFVAFALFAGVVPRGAAASDGLPAERRAVRGLGSARW